MNSPDNTLSRPPEPVQLGAEVWIEPDMTPAQMDHCMALLRDHAMPVARIFLEWDPDPRNHGPWSLELYDQVFDSAARHGVGLVATLAPPFPALTYAQLDDSRRHMSALVSRYKHHPALDTWLLFNEPSAWPADSEVAMAEYVPWLRGKYGTVEELNKTWGSRHASWEDLKWQPAWAAGERWNSGAYVDCWTFWRDHHGWQLRFIADAIRALDDRHPLHVNPHGLMGNLASSCDDLPAWRTFLSTLGASLHPAWHFGLLERRDQYALGVSYVCDLVRGASEPNPFWVTELQGGNNVYSGTQPLCPTGGDIAQWTWVGLGSGARRVIYWLLNARASGVEAGEWSLLDLQGRPGGRLAAAGSIGEVLRREAGFFSQSRVLASPVTILLSLETMTVQQRQGDEDGQGHVLEALGLYEAFQTLGIPADVKHVHDYDWRAETASPRFAVLPHVSALSRSQTEDVREFVRRGGYVLATGLTGFYDPMTRVWPMGDFPLADVFGGTFREVCHLAEPGALELGPLSLTLPTIMLPTRGFVCEIENQAGSELCRQGPRVLATTHEYGAGRVYWVPSRIGLGAWRGDRGPLADFLGAVAGDALASVPFRFGGPSPDVLLRTLESGEGAEFVTIITNGAASPRSCRLIRPAALAPRVLWASAGAGLAGETVTLGPRGTVVVHWAG